MDKTLEHWLDLAIEGVKCFNAELAAVELPKVQKGTLPDACRTYKAIRDKYEELDEHRKKLLEHLENLNRDTIPTMMEDQKAPSIKVECAGGIHYRFVRSQRLSVSMLNKEAGIQWLRDAGQGGIVQETVNAQTLSAFVKRWIQEDGRDVPEEFFKLNTMNIVSVTKA